MTHTHHWIIVPRKRKGGKKPLESDLSRLFVVYCQLKLPRLLLFDSLNKNEKAKKSCCVTQPPPPSCQLQLLRTLCPTATQHCILAWVRPTELEEQFGGIKVQKPFRKEFSKSIGLSGKSDKHLKTGTHQHRKDIAVKDNKEHPIQAPVQWSRSFIGPSVVMDLLFAAEQYAAAQVSELQISDFFWCIVYIVNSI